MANTYLTRTPASAGNRDKWTYSAWVKRGNLGAYSNIIQASGSSSNDSDYLYFNATDSLDLHLVSGGTPHGKLYTNRKFRDTSGWYHIVIVYDSGNATSGDRLIMYINGVRETSFSTALYPSQNQDSVLTLGSGGIDIGRDGSSSGSGYYEGLMSHLHLCDGYAYPASTFGETDATTGEWKINTSPTVTYGTNGFFILKDGNSITDSSPNSNNFTLGGGTLTNTEDCPSDVFATMNPVDKYAVGLSNGNNTVTNENNASTIVLSTLAVSSGKYYWEAKVEDSTADNFNVGIKKTGQHNYGVSGSSYNSTGWVYAVDGNIYHGGSNILSTGTTAAVGDIIGFILDMDTGTLKLKKNGSDIYSGNAVITGLNTGDHYHVVQGASQSKVSFNFGNGYFGTTAIASAGTNASNIGVFEYDVPTGYTALSTKGLNN